MVLSVLRWDKNEQDLALSFNFPLYRSLEEKYNSRSHQLKLRFWVPVECCLIRSPNCWGCFDYQENLNFLGIGVGVLSYFTVFIVQKSSFSAYRCFWEGKRSGDGKALVVLPWVGF